MSNPCLRVKPCPSTAYKHVEKMFKKKSRHNRDVKKGVTYRNPLILLVGASRFELPTTRTPSECATRLRYAPISMILLQLTQYFSEPLFDIFDYLGRMTNFLLLQILFRP